MVKSRDVTRAIKTIAQQCGLSNVTFDDDDADQPVTRGQFACWVDQVLDPFGRIAVDHDGNQIIDNRL